MTPHTAPYAPAYDPNYARAVAEEDALLTRGVLLRRVVGWAIDAAILSVLMAVAWSVTAIFGVLTLGLGMPLLGALPVIPFIYAWLFLASGMSATPGQAMMGLVVCRNDDLQPPTGAQALAFVLGYAATIALGAIWLVLALFTTRRRAPHDLLSGLVVVRQRALRTAR